MNIDYSLWPIWCDYLEEQGQNTELLRYVLQYNTFNPNSFYITVRNIHSYFGSGLHYGEFSKAIGAGYGYSYWQEMDNRAEINAGNCCRAFRDRYYGCGGRDFSESKGDGIAEYSI